MAVEITNPVPDEAAPRRRRGARARTIPQQIADHVASAIVNGEYRDGERLREQELAEMYGVSRGPVREAIRELEKHGLAVLHPRRGAYVIGVSLDFIIESFNVRAALAGVAARYFARRHPEEGLQELAARVAELDAMAESPTVDAFGFATQVAVCARAIYRNAGAPQLARLLQEQFHGTIWGLMWRAQPIDYLDVPRRRVAAADWRHLLEAVEAADEQAAERAFRRDVLAARDSVVATLAVIRGETPPAPLLIAD